MNKPVIICIDDEPTVLESLKIELKKALGDAYIIEATEGGEEALELFKELMEDEYEVALVLSDYIMPDIKGDELLKRIHTISPQTLKIMLTGQADLEAVSNAIKYAKLYRYIAKPWQPEDLKITVLEAVHSYLQDKKLTEQNTKLQQMNQQLEELNLHQAALIRERTSELEKANQELHRLANLDGLTKIANRRCFDQYLTQEWQRLAKMQQPLSIIFADIDSFKSYNDQYGHQAGDDCLRAVSQAMSSTLTKGLVARYGGEEFAFVLPNTETTEAVQTAIAIQSAIQQLKIAHQPSTAVKEYLTLSLGIATTIPQQECLPSTLTTQADIALYKAKKQGRNRYCINKAGSSQEA